MKYLLDTCTLLWTLLDSPVLPENIRQKLITQPKEHLFVSIISIWEVSIKISKEKLAFPGGVKGLLARIKQGELTVINIKEEYTEVIETLPFIHKDPFDRMLIATAKVEDMTLITADEKIHQYNVKTLWK